MANKRYNLFFTRWYDLKEYPHVSFSDHLLLEYVEKTLKKIGVIAKVNYYDKCPYLRIDFSSKEDMILFKLSTNIKEINSFKVNQITVPVFKFIGM